MEWSPQDAMQAYLHTLHLCKQSSHVIEPKCAEFVAAMAAGKLARLMVEVAAEGSTPLTVALAAAARQTGGRFVCVLLSRRHAEAARARLRATGLLGPAVELIECTETPCQALDKYEGVDFAAVDCRIGDSARALKLNPKGSTVVAYNLTLDDPFLHVLKLPGKSGVESHVTLPLLVGEFGRLGFSSSSSSSSSSRARFLGSNNDGNNNRNIDDDDDNNFDDICKGRNKKIRSTRKYRRFHVTFEN